MKLSHWIWLKIMGQWGLENIHIVDLDGTRDGKSGNGEVIEEIIEKSNLKIQLGGGIRSKENIKQWFDTGINSFDYRELCY